MLQLLHRRVKVLRLPISYTGAAVHTSKYMINKYTYIYINRYYQYIYIYILSIFSSCYIFIYSICMCLYIQTQTYMYVCMYVCTYSLLTFLQAKGLYMQHMFISGSSQVQDDSASSDGSGCESTDEGPKGNAGIEKKQFKECRQDCRKKQRLNC